MNNDYSRGVEVVTGVFIKRNNQVLVVRSPKWNTWVIPGGHVDPGETILDCACREAKEETGLDVKPIKIIRSGELIGSPEFHRKCHLIFFHCLVKPITTKVKLDNDELVEYRWITLEEGLSLNLSNNVRTTIQMLLETNIVE